MSWADESERPKAVLSDDQRLVVSNEIEVRMKLESAYDALYRGGTSAEELSDTPLRRHPQNRTEAIVAVPGTGDILLDVGSGDGRLLFAHRTRYAHLIGLEFSSERLRQAAENLAGLPVTLHRGTAENMHQIESASVDRIIVSDVIEHVVDIYAATAEMHRVLRPGGLLIVNTPNIAYIRHRMRLAAGRFPSTSQSNEGLGSDILFDGGHLHYFTFRSLRLLLERAGFNVMGRMGYGHFGWIYPPLLSIGVQLMATTQCSEG